MQNYNDYLNRTRNETIFSCALPKGNLTRRQRTLDVDEALIAATPESQADVTLGHHKGAVNEDIQFTDHIEQGGVLFYLLPGVTREAPDVIVQFLLDAVDERSCSLGLKQGVSAAEGDGRLVISNDPHQLVEGALFPTPKVPRVGIMATRATMVAARHVD